MGRQTSGLVLSGLHHMEIIRCRQVPENFLLVSAPHGQRVRSRVWLPTGAWVLLLCDLRHCMHTKECSHSTHLSGPELRLGAAVLLLGPGKKSLPSTLDSCHLEQPRHLAGPSLVNPAALRISKLAAICTAASLCSCSEVGAALFGQAEATARGLADCQTHQRTYTPLSSWGRLLGSWRLEGPWLMCMQPG